MTLGAAKLLHDAQVHRLVFYLQRPMGQFRAFLHLPNGY